MNWPNQALKTRAYVRDWSNPNHPNKIGIQGTLIPQPAKNRCILCFWDGVWKYGSLPNQREDLTAKELWPGQITSLWPDAWRLPIQEIQKNKGTQLQNGLHLVYMNEQEFDDFLETVQRMDGPQLAALKKQHAHANPAQYTR